MTLYGGARARAIRSSLFRFVHSGLNDLGWFSTGKGFTPITFLDEIPTYDAQNITSPNTLALIDGESESRDMELGSFNGEESWHFAFDFFAENDAVGLQVIRDVKSMLDGRHPDIGRIFPILPILDVTQATPPLVGYADIERVTANRMSGPKPFMRYWFTCECQIIDYNNEGDGVPFTGYGSYGTGAYGG
jgi:hypothetical protein